MELPIYILALFFTIAFIYGSVGHGGASGYLAVFVLTGLFIPDYVPVVLLLNIAVTTVALFNYGSRGHFDWSLFWPFALGSVPAAFLGGLVNLDISVFNKVVGAALLVMAVIIIYRIFFGQKERPLRPVKITIALAFGTGIGFLSGLIGVGGGIFLSPLILFLGWADMRKIAAVSALFVLVNSASGLAGHAFTTGILWETAAWLIIPVLAGGYIGSLTGVKSSSTIVIRGMLALVLLIAALKMLF